MLGQLRYLRLKYDARTRAFTDVVNRVLKAIPKGETRGLTPRILGALNADKISLVELRSIDDLQKEFPFSKICYDENNDRWFLDDRMRLLSIEKLLDVSAEKISRKAVEEYMRIIGFQVDAARLDARYDKMLNWLDAFARMRNDHPRLIDDSLLQQLLFAITNAVKILSQMGSRTLVEAFRQRYADVKFDRRQMIDTTVRGLFSPSENRFFDWHAEMADRNRRIYDLCSDFEKKGGKIEEISLTIKSMDGVNLKKVIPPLLNLRKNHLIVEIQNFRSLRSVTLDDVSRMNARFAELEQLVADDRVHATEQVISNLVPVVLKVLERIYLDPSFTTNQRCEALEMAMARVGQKTAYANFKLGSIYELILRAVQELDESRMAAHLSFYRHVMEHHFPIFNKSMAQIEREADEIKRMFLQKKMGL